MAGFTNGSYAKVWKFEDKGNYGNAQVSISHRRKDSGAYVTDFSSNFVSVFGDAYNFLKNTTIPENGLFCIFDRVSVTTNIKQGNNGKSVTYYNFSVDKISPYGGRQNAQAPSPVVDEDEEEELPF